MAAKRTISLCIILMICFNVKSQNIAATADTITYAKKNEKFYLNNKKLQLADMGPLLMKFNSSAIEFKQYQRIATPGTIILLTGLTSGVLAFTRINKSNHFFNPYSITLFAGDLIGIPLMMLAKKHLRKSSMLYNKEILRVH